MDKPYKSKHYTQWDAADISDALADLTAWAIRNSNDPAKLARVGIAIKPDGGIIIE